MLVIFGWGFTTTHIFGAVFPQLCPNCHNEQFWILKRVRRWFTLFFIPIFPYESTHALMCPICGVGREMSGIELRRAKLFAETNSAYHAGALRQDEYEARLGGIAEASDAQVSKGLTYVAATTISAAADAELTYGHRQSADNVFAAPLATTDAPRSASHAEFDGKTGNRVFCLGCGRVFEDPADSFCPECGSPQPCQVSAC